MKESFIEKDKLPEAWRSFYIQAKCLVKEKGISEIEFSRSTYLAVAQVARVALRAAPQAAPSLGAAVGSRCRSGCNADRSAAPDRAEHRGSAGCGRSSASPARSQAAVSP